MPTSNNTEDESNLANIATDLVHSATTIPLPPAVQKSLFKSLGVLIYGIVDVPVAWLEGKAQAIRDETAARSHVTIAAAQASAKRFTSDEQMVERATHYLGARLIREQKNRESIAAAAVETLKSDRPTTDSTTEIDADWLHMFARIAETKSNADMQAYFGKLLAGEIRKPGSFSPATVEVLARLTPDLAQNFQDLCCVSAKLGDDNEAIVIMEPYDSDSADALSPIGIHYIALCDMQDVGLLGATLSSVVTINEGDLVNLPVDLAGKLFRITGTPRRPRVAHRWHVVKLTRSGEELRRIVHMIPNADYLARLREWLTKNTALELRDAV